MRKKLNWNLVSNQEFRSMNFSAKNIFLKNMNFQAKIAYCLNFEARKLKDIFGAKIQK